MSKDETREKALKDAKQSLKAEIDRDLLLVKAVKFLEALETGKELERFSDWYSLHFPELVDELKPRELVKVLQNGVERTELESFSELAENSTGGGLKDEDGKILETVTRGLETSEELKQELEDYIEYIAREELPNLSRLLGPVLAAELVALSGSLEKLAKSPSSTVQMLGAEKALFRHLREGGDPPKHGILFHHEFVSPLQESKRGKMARYLANKAVMAARLDFYGGEKKGDELRKEAEDKFMDLKD